jgi:hypothetical protein
MQSLWDGCVVSLKSKRTGGTFVPLNILLAFAWQKMVPVYRIMIHAQSSSPRTILSRRQKILRRVLSFLIVAVCVGIVIHFASTTLSKNPAPAGFARGMLQGALMPGALPNLLVGNDVTIYAANNTGRTYKLGYTCGVNACGAIFFGFFFWRVSRWRKG